MGCSWAPLGRSGALLGRSWGSCFFLRIFKNVKKNTKFVIFGDLGLLLGVPQTIRHRFLTLRGSILTLRGMISRPSHRQTPSPNSSKVLAKSWRSPCENHNQHSVQPKRMNSKRWCGGLASAFSIRRPLRANVLDTYPLIRSARRGLPSPYLSHRPPKAAEVPTLATLVRRWRPLFALLGRSWRALGRSWPLLGRSWNDMRKSSKNRCQK